MSIRVERVVKDTSRRTYSSLNNVCQITRLRDVDIAKHFDPRCIQFHWIFFKDFKTTNLD